MYIKFNRKETLEALRTITKNVREDKSNNKVNIAIISNEMEILIRNNCGIYGNAYVPIENKEKINKRFGLNKSFFIDILAKMDTEEVSMVFEKEKNTVDVKSGKAKFSLLLIKEDSIEIPVFEQKDVVFERTFSEEEYTNLFSKALISVGTDENRPVFTGVTLHTDGKNMYVDASDTHVISRITCADDTPESWSIIPAEMARITPNDDVSLRFTAKQMEMTFGNTKFVSSFVDGKAPDFDRAIPSTDGRKSFIINKAKFLATLDRAMICSSIVGSSPIKITFDKNAIIVEAENPELGAVKEQLELVKMDESLEGQVVGFNGKLLKGVKEFDSINIVGYYDNPLSPIVFNSDDNTPEYFKYVVSPIRIKA